LQNQTPTQYCPDLFCQGPYLYGYWAPYLFIATGADDMSSAPIFFEKKQPDNASSVEANEVSSDLPRFRLLWWPENQSLSFFNRKTRFQPIFDPKHCRNRDKPIYDLKNRPKNQNQLEVRSIFSWILKKKNLTWTPLIKWNRLTQISSVLIA
jgi:hypothetical protein